MESTNKILRLMTIAIGFTFTENLIDVAVAGDTNVMRILWLFIWPTLIIWTRIGKKKTLTNAKPDSDDNPATLRAVHFLNKFVRVSAVIMWIMVAAQLVMLIIDISMGHIFPERIVAAHTLRLLLRTTAAVWLSIVSKKGI
ncbi:MAG: hypothetical protein FWE08_08075 [Oscillospiraceae bacterium]|nr:hypothetical protein [Oscillospiraceae bacterium]